jgi:hypothetical protein
LNQPDFSTGLAPEAKQREVFPREHFLENTLTSALLAQGLRAAAFGHRTSCCLIMIRYTDIKKLLIFCGAPSRKLS